MFNKDNFSLNIKKLSNDLKKHQYIRISDRRKIDYNSYSSSSVSTKDRRTRITECPKTYRNINCFSNEKYTDTTPIKFENLTKSSNTFRDNNKFSPNSYSTNDYIKINFSEKSPQQSDLRTPKLCDDINKNKDLESIIKQKNILIYKLTDDNDKLKEEVISLILENKKLKEKIHLYENNDINRTYNENNISTENISKSICKKQTLNVNTEMQETENNFDLIKNKAKEILDRYSKIIKNKNF